MNGAWQRFAAVATVVALAGGTVGAAGCGSSGNDVSSAISSAAQQGKKIVKQAGAEAKKAGNAARNSANQAVQQAKKAAQSINKAANSAANQAKKKFK